MLSIRQVEPQHVVQSCDLASVLVDLRGVNPLDD
jgi:hypothetical protein